MEFVLLLILTVVVIVTVAVVGARARQRESLAKAFQSLARKYHGSYRRIDRYQQVVVFRREGGLYRIAIERKRGFFRKCRIVIEINGWGATDTRLVVHPRRLMDLIRPSSVGSGNFAFNMSYLVRGKPRERVKQLLTNGVRARINLLQQMSQSKAFRVELEDGKFRVERKGILLPYGFLERFCEAAIYLCDEMVGVLAVGIDFDESTEDVILNPHEARCKVCGEDFNAHDEIVACRKCNTPHHKDCWQFSGVCSVYGCGEKRFRRVESPAPVS